MGVSRISFKHPVITRGGNKVRFYHIYPDEIHGAYEGKNDQWHICRWRLDGYFIEPNVSGKQFMSSLDLINESDVASPQPVNPPHAA